MWGSRKTSGDGPANNKKILALHSALTNQVGIHKTFLTVFLRNFLRTKFKKILRNYFFGIHNPFFMIFVKVKNFLSLFDTEMPNNNFFLTKWGKIPYIGNF